VSARILPLRPRRGVDLTKTPEQCWHEPHNYPDLREHAATAALVAGSLGFDAPFQRWTGLSDGRAICLLPGGTRLLYTPTRTSSGSSLTAYRLCDRGCWHAQAVPTPDHLAALTSTTPVCDAHIPHLTLIPSGGTVA